MARRPVRNSRCYTLSALAAILAVSAAVSVILVEMSPAPILLSITNTTQKSHSTFAELTFTLAAINSSPRARVLYRSIYVVVCSNNNTTNTSSSGAPDAGRPCIGIDMAPVPLHQNPSSTERIHAAAKLEGADSPWVSLGIMPSLNDFGGNFNDVSVNVSALARFKRPGIPWTSLYNINASCNHIRFISQANHSSAVVADELSDSDAHYCEHYYRRLG
ncbi:hypothetical protein SETIT_7G053500v2 [Setaria italica]|uniref:Late embryogenesis abundant protein LEA-2 subgroup domain-containing protein n=1 Tax=Setaria italica TaxID=4555 RepID=K3Y9Y9_SETIT|nr:hypothetical protein SETIT_7G053500v2 [Setaria italica]